MENYDVVTTYISIYAEATRQEMQQRTLNLTYVSTEHQLADPLTKRAGSRAFLPIDDHASLCPCHSLGGVCLLNTVQFLGPYLLHCNFAISVGMENPLSSYLLHCNFATPFHVCGSFLDLLLAPLQLVGLYAAVAPSKSLEVCLATPYVFFAIFAFHVHTWICATRCLILALLELSLLIFHWFCAVCRCISTSGMFVSCGLSVCVPYERGGGRSILLGCLE